MGSLILVDNVRNFVRNKVQNLDGCKKIIDLSDLSKLSEDQLINSVRFFKERYNEEYKFYQDVDFVLFICLNKDQGYLGYAVELIKDAVAELKLEEDYELYVELITCLVYYEKQGGI